MKLIFSAIVAVLLTATAFATQQPQIESRIVQGSTAERGMFPFYVFLRILRRHEQNICGGGLISEQWVLTAAHCLENALSLQVHLGSVSTTYLREDGHKMINMQFITLGENVHMFPKFTKLFE